MALQISLYNNYTRLSLETSTREQVVSEHGAEIGMSGGRTLVITVHQHTHPLTNDYYRNSRLHEQLQQISDPCYYLWDSTFTLNLATRLFEKKTVCNSIRWPSFSCCQAREAVSRQLVSQENWRHRLRSSVSWANQPPAGDPRRAHPSPVPAHWEARPRYRWATISTVGREHSNMTKHTNPTKIECYTIIIYSIW